MKKMTDFISLNFAWLLLALIGLVLIGFAVKNFKKPEPEVLTTKSANFADDPVAGTPVMTDNPHSNIFYEAAWAAINEGANPWIYLNENWEKVKKSKSVEDALLDFITNEAHRDIPDSSRVKLSIRNYSDPNSVVMEYRDPTTDSVMITTGHDPEASLYATFYNKKDSVTYKLICANGLVRELFSTTPEFSKNYVMNFNCDYLIKPGDSFIGITGSTVYQAAKFAEENGLPVRFVVEGTINSKFPNTSKMKVLGDYKNAKKGIFDVIIQPNDILRKQDGKWLYVKN